MRKRRPGGPRRGQQIDKGYVSFLQTHGYCVICFCREIDGAHTENNGMSSKGPDASRVPLCRDHHREYDAGRVKFEAVHHKDMKAEAAWWYARYQEVRRQ